MAQLKDLMVMGDARVVGNLYDNNPNVAFGTCTTAASQQHKVVTIANPTWALQVGTVIGVKFSYSNSFSSQTSTPITLNVNGTGDINIWYNTTHSGSGNTGTSNAIYGTANRVNYYMYDGTYWVWMNMGVLDGNDVSTTRQENGRVYAGTNGIARYSLIALDKDGKYQSLITLAATGTGTNKTINTGAKFKLEPIIKWYNANNDATNGNLVGSTYAIYTQHCNMDTRYSHNHTTTFTTNSPLYIECTIDNDGYWSPTTTCITQTLTSGKYYIYLGETYSTEYQLSLNAEHPVYYYDGTKLNAYMHKYVADHSGGGGTATDVQINGTSITSNNVANIITNSAYNASSNKIATMSDLPTNTDAKVAQTATTTSAAYELLFSETADNTTRTEGARKTNTLTYNPSTKALSTGGTVNGYTLAAACAKAVVTSVDTSASLPTSNAVKTFVEGKGYKKITYGYVDPTGGSTDDIYIQLA